MAAPIDITNQTFNLLTAIRPVLNIRDNGRIWLFKCECGTLCEKQANAVKFGSVKSCGCLKGKLRNRKQTLEALKRPRGAAGLDLLYSDMKYTSKKRGKDFTLTKAQLKEITSKNCFYCGAIPSKIKKVNRSKWGRKETLSLQEFKNHMIKIMRNKEWNK